MYTIGQIIPKGSTVRLGTFEELSWILAHNVFIRTFAELSAKMKNKTFAVLESVDGTESEGAPQVTILIKDEQITLSTDWLATVE